jgi:uncharacterized phage infection (PIP) family protein YhgE
MIEESVKSAELGVKITEDVAKHLTTAVERSGKVSDIIAEIAAASNEQAQGIEQVNTAVAQMNQVTQQNAANSEESASAAEELNSQASELANMVANFKLSTGGGTGGGKPAARKPAAKLPPPAAPRPQVHVAAIPDKRAGGGASDAKTTRSIKAVKSAEEIIPLNDDELSEF